MKRTLTVVAATAMSILAGSVALAEPVAAKTITPFSFDDCPSSSVCLWGAREGEGVMLAVPHDVGTWETNFVPFSARNNTAHTYCVLDAFKRPLLQLLPNTASNLTPAPFNARYVSLC